MSYVLRHGLIEAGLVPDCEGYVKLTDFIRVSDSRYGLDKAAILSIAAKCSKQRFGVKTTGGETFIRSNQGHSRGVGALISADKMLKRLTSPLRDVFHGTYKKHLGSIRAHGLKRMSRQHIHLARGLDAVSGRRHDNDLVVYVDMGRAMGDGIQFYESENGVILTEGVNGVLPAAYLSYAELVKGVPKTIP